MLVYDYPAVDFMTTRPSTRIRLYGGLVPCLSPFASGIIALVASLLMMQLADTRKAWPTQRSWQGFRVSAPCEVIVCALPY